MVIIFPTSPTMDQEFVVDNRLFKWDGVRWRPQATPGSFNQLLDLPETFTPATHTHSTTEITSGTLDLARGGTARTDGRATGFIEIRNNDSTQVWIGTESQYNSLTPDVNVLYLTEE